MRPTVPRPVNLRVDPFEQHMDAPGYPLYVGEKLWTILLKASCGNNGNTVRSFAFRAVRSVYDKPLQTESFQRTRTNGLERLRTFAMQKVEGSSPFIRSSESPAPAGFSCPVVALGVADTPASQPLVSLRGRRR